MIKLHFARDLLGTFQFSYRRKKISYLLAIDGQFIFILNFLPNGIYPMTIFHLHEKLLKHLLMSVKRFFEKHVMRMLVTMFGVFGE